MTRSNSRPHYRLSLLSLLLVAAWAPPALAKVDLTELSLEQLLDEEIVSASRVSQKASDAPSAITVLRKEDFRAYGWRTLAEALNSVRGFLTTNGDEYTYVAVRGFATPGDYNSRLLLMIDGIRSNGPVYDQAYVGQEFPLDLDLIERIEIVRGPGSMVYGGNAFFGVINIITKAGKDMGTEVAAAAGSYGTRAARLGFGKQLDNGADLLLSASGLTSDGQAKFYPELGQASLGTDDTHARRFFARYRQGDLQFTALFGEREHGRPSGAYGSVFDDPRNRDWDETLLLDGRYQTDLSEHTQIIARLFFGQSIWHGQYVNDYTGVPYDLDKEKSHGQWWGVDSQLHYTGFSGHRLLVGLDFQNNLKQDQFAEDAPPSLFRCVATESLSDPCLADRRDSYRLGVYLQDDLRLSDSLNLNLGLRHDSSDVDDSHWSPRLGLIWRPNPENVVKLLYGSAFRAPNAYERYYFYPGVGAAIANPGLKAETIQTYEAVWERYLSADLRLTAGANVNQVENWIVQVDTGTALQFQNQPGITSRGIELELEKSFAGGARLRTSYTGQFAPERPNGLINTPSRHLLKANFATPLPMAHWYLGLEAQYASGQITPNGRTSDYTIANANLRWQPTGSDNTELAMGIYNLFDTNYAHSFPDDSLYSGIPRESMAQDGRTWQLKLTHRF